MDGGKHKSVGKKLCRTCRQEAHKYCGGCTQGKKSKRVRYCDRACQEADWHKHRKKCPWYVRKTATQDHVGADAKEPEFTVAGVQATAEAMGYSPERVQSMHSFAQELLTNRGPLQSAVVLNALLAGRDDTQKQEMEARARIYLDAQLAQYS
jgi:hypothetical protein